MEKWTVLPMYTPTTVHRYLKITVLSNIVHVSQLKPELSNKGNQIPHNIHICSGAHNCGLCSTKFFVIDQSTDWPTDRQINQWSNQPYDDSDTSYSSFFWGKYKYIFWGIQQKTGYVVFCSYVTFQSSSITLAISIQLAQCIVNGRNTRG